MVSSRQAVIFVFFAWFALVGISQANEVGPKVGQMAPDFEINDLEGKVIKLADLRQKGHVMLIFWSTRCSYCHAMLPKFKHLYSTYKGNGLSVVGINIGFEDQPEVNAYAMQFEIPYPVLNEDDKKEDIVNAWKVRGTPTIQIVAPDGKVVYRGYSLPKKVDNFITDLISNSIQISVKE